MANEMKYASANIKLLLMSKKMTQGDLCKKTGMIPTTLYKRLNVDPGNWKMTEALSVAKALGSTVQEIFFTHMLPKCNADEKVS